MSAEKKAFIEKYKDSAIVACAGTGLFPSVMIAQALIESGFGKSELAARYNNFFGIKADSSWHGQKVYLKNGKNDPNKYSWYRVYANAEESFKDRCDFLKQNPRYTKHGVFSAQTPLAQIQAMKNAGYAESPNYVQSIVGEIKYYGLDAFDALSNSVAKIEKNISSNFPQIPNITSGKILSYAFIGLGVLALGGAIIYISKD